MRCSEGLSRSACYHVQRALRSSPIKSSPIIWHYLSKPVPYLEALRLQENLVSGRANSRAALLKHEQKTHQLSSAELEKHTATASQDILLLLQHTSVYTTGRRDTHGPTLDIERERLTRLGADYVSTQRGGQTTYHGPGQLVGYPILDIGAMDVSV